ncbi:non-ribosomal peptide synthetase [uncultured Flavobacterium sp.]|uniref:non-ribosomal peptide synthetase n=1 Tax=uncultured Flavobacterium sp. TaxID=165435 RepID=UPI00292D90AE|nr:non-ribosomal peptide synthetase [uncultured Flavobacterium sp.]
MKELLSKLRENKIYISLENEDLKIKFDQQIPDSLLKEIKEKKLQIIQFLKTNTQTTNNLPIAKTPEADSYILSSSQRRMWILSRFTDSNIAYNMPSVYMFEGNLDITALNSAFNQLIERHEILRTFFNENEEGETMQFIVPGDQFEFVIDSHNLQNEENQESQLANLIEAELSRPFDLSKLPLLRANLYQLSANKWAFSFVMHHIIGDGWSMKIFINELLQFYNAQLKGQNIELPVLTIQYKDYAAWQQVQLSGSTLSDHRDYWLNQFNDELPVLDIATDKIRPIVKTYNGGNIVRFINEDIYKGIQTLSQEQSGSLFMGLLSGVVGLLYHYSHQEDIIIGSPIAGRENSALDGQIGFYLNTLALRTRFKGDNSFKTLLNEVRKTTLEAYAHQVFPFDQLIEELNLKRDLSRSVLFDVFIDYHDNRSSDLQDKSLDDLKMSVYEGYEGAVPKMSKFDLTFIFTESDHGLSLLLEYNSDIYTEATAEAMFSHFEALMQAAVASPDSALNTLDYLSKDEQEKLTEEFNTVEFNYNKDTTVNVLDLFQEQVQQHPDARALYYQGVTLSYKELDSQSDNLAYYLQNTCAIQKGDLVGIMQDRSEKMIVSILGILKSGAAYVPIDPSYPQERKEYIIRDTAIKVLLTQTDYMFDLGNYTGAVFAVDAQLESLESQTVSTKITPSDLAYIIYTSGSTGQPKGCMLAHSNLSHYIQWANHHYFTPETGNFGLYTSLSFDLTITSIFSALTRGKELTIYGQYGELSDILKDSFSARSGIDSIKLTPSHIKLLEQLNIESTTMTRAIVGGEAVSTAHVQILKKINPDIRIYNEYGPTETTVGCMVEELEQDKAVLIGKPISGTKIYILGPSQELLPIGVAGEICIAGMGVGLGYLNQETLSAEKFTENPFLRGERMYRSGDIGRWQADGKLEYLGRKDDQVKIRGYRIEPGEIESVLQGHPSIATSAVVAQSNSEGDKELIAYLVSKDQDATLDVSDIRAYLSQHLPSYQVPAHYMQLESLPLTTNGKLDKAQLPSLDGLGTLKSHAYVAPRTQSEQQLAMIWQEILNREQIGIHDDFFELGGHSLTATRLASQLHKELGVKVELKDIFTYPVLEAQAALIDKSLKTAFEDIVPVAQQEAYELSSSQRRLWMLSQFTDGSVAYNMPGIYIFEGNLEIQALNTAFKGLIQRHEILRTYFKEYENGEVFQVIVPVNEFAFEIASYDLQHSKDQESELSMLIHQEILTAFDLSELPLLRANLYQLSANKWAFSTVMHHIISDGWSMGIMIKELLEFYNAEIKGEAVTLEELAIQYKDYAAWQQEQLKGAALESHRDYWLNQLGGSLPVLDIATDKARPQIKTYNGSSILRPLSPQVHTGIQNLSQEQGGTLFMGLLTGVTGLLYHYSGQNDIIIGSPIAGREHSALDGQIGFYLNTLALRLEFKGEDSFKTLLQEARKTTLDAYAHQVFPFDQLIDELSLKRDLSRNVLFDVLIDYHDNRSVNKPKSPELEGLSVSGYQGDTPRMSKFDLTFMFLESDHGLSLLLEYNSDIYTEATAEAMFSHFEQLMQAAVASPDSALNTLDYLSKAEQEKQTEEFNAVEFNYNNGNSENSYINVLDLFKEQVTQNPDARALYYGGTALSYKELDSQSDNLAYYLQNTYAIQKGDLVGIMQDRSEKMIVSILGILKSGAAYVPIDPSYPQERKEYIISDTAIRILLTQTDYMFDLGNYTGAVFAVDAQLESLESHAAPIVELKETDLAYIIYTSGSTGQPKGCMLAHANLSHYIQWANHHYFTPETGNFGLYTSLSFDLTITSIFSALTRGKELTIYGQYGELSDILKDSFSAESGIDSIKLTPSHIKLLEQLNIESTTMTRAIVGGEAVSTAHVQILKKINPDIRIFNEYGPTETTVGCMVEELEENKAVLIGKPISGTKIYILGPSQELLPIGVAGEICIAGMGVGLGYLNQETLSAEKFIENPFIKGERMYRSGDIGRWQADGKLEYLGRKDDQVKIRGYRIEPGEIESVLQGHPSIATSAVVAQSNNEGDKELIAYLVSKDQDATLDVSDIRTYLFQHLPAYQVPAHYMQLESLPLTTNGKLDKGQLPSLDGLGSLRASEYVAPTTQREETIVGIWEEILNREPIGIRDDFFDLGGDSIKILRMMAGLRRELDLDVPIGEVYRQSTIESLLKHVDANKDIFDARNQTQNQHRIQVLEELEVLKSEILSTLPNADAIEDVYPMSDIEKGMIFESLVDSSKGVYHDQMIHHRIFKDFDPKRFENALRLLVQKHSILRTSFHMEGYATEVQMVHKDIDARLHYVDLRNQTREAQEKTVKDFLDNEMKSPFIVNTAPLWRMAAFDLGQDEVFFVFQCHHAIIDGWSDALFMTELNNLYLELEQNPTFSPAPLQSSYRDFIIEHETAKRDPAIQTFWKQDLQGYNRLALFTDEEEITKNLYTLGQEELTRLEEFAKARNTTVKAVSLAAYMYMLKVLSYNSEEIVTGLVSHMRPTCEDSDKLLGCFLNTIPFKAGIDHSVNADQLIDTVHQKLISLKDKERLSMLEISLLHNKQGRQGNPFFDVLFDYVDFHAYGAVKKGEATIDQYDSLSELSVGGMDLTNTFLDFIINRTDGFYNLSIRLTHKLQCGFTTDRLAELYFAILSSMQQEPSARLKDNNHLSPAEQEKLTEEFNTVEFNYNKDTTVNVLDLFQEQVQQHPDARALYYQGVTLSYKELDSQSDNLAYYLQNTCAIQKGDLVGIMQDRSEKMIVSILGILKSGAAYVPIDPSYPQERKEYIIRDTAIKVLLTQTDYMFDLGNYTGAVFAVDAQLESLESQTVSTKITPSDLAYIIYTSGSTGQPKGCMLAHSNLSHYIQWANHHYFTPETGNFGLYTSLSFDLTITSIFSALTRGKELTIYGQYGELSDILKDSFSARSGIDSIKLTPSHIKLLEQLNIESTTMTRAIVGGEAVSTAHVQILKKINPDIRIYNEYGPTETTVGCMVEELEQDKAVLIGKPISGTKIYILGPSQELLPIGVAGEICIAGMGVGLGYLNQETLSAEKFTENPFLRGERMYRSGDIGRWQADGKLEYLGRKDDQVKIRGYRIEPGEIESVLQGHPSIATSAVVAQSNSEGDKELIAYLVSKDQDATLDVSDIRAYLSQHLPSYQVPAHYMQLESLPLTTNGKLDKAQLPSLDGLGTLKSHAYVAPRTQSEQQLAVIWQEILNREQIGIHDDFFELGGHSLTATRLASQLHKELGVKVELKDIFTYPVLQAQASLIEKSLKTAFVDIVPIAEQEAYGLSSSQRRLWMLSQFTDGSVAYNMPGIYIFEGNLDVQALNIAFKGLIKRHEILRTYFKETQNGEVLQVIVPSDEFAFEIEAHDLQGRKEQESELSILIHQEILTAFDLSRLPLLRANLYQLSKDKWAFSTVMHHIISDGWSMGIMIKELLEFYNAEIKAEAATLEELAIQYKDYAAWQQEQLKGAALESHRDYWLNQLKGELSVLDIATDRLRPQIKTYNGNSILRPLSPEVHTGIQTLSQEQGGTLFMGLLTGVTSLLYHYSAQEDIIIGSPIAGREHSALDGQIGFYLNTLALRLQFKGDASFKTLLQEARKTTLDAYAHQVFPFDQLIDELSLKRDLSRNVLFDVLIDYHDNRSVNKPKSPELEGLSVSGYQGDTPRMSKFDLTFMFLESDQGLSLLLEYNSDIYTEATAEAMFSHFEQLMQAAVTSPDKALNTLEYISAAERHQLTEEFNAVEFNYNKDTTVNVLDMFQEQVTQNPDATALHYQGTTLSYKELDVQSDNLAYYLQNTCAIQKGDLVGIMQDRSEKMIVSILGILKSGAAYVPIDPSYPQERKEYIISDTAIRILLTQTDYMFDLGNYTGAVFAVDAQLESLESHAAPIVELKETDLAYIIYTSGSTGQPKGCMLAHANLSYYIQWANHHYFTPETGNFGLYTSLSFDLTITSIFSALTRGKELTIYGQYGELSDILKDSFSAESGIDSIKLTPSHIKLLEQLNIESTTMTRAIVGGEAVSTAHVQILKKINPDIRIFNEYGPTETTVGCMVEELEENKAVLIGKPISGTKIYILGPSQELLPIGVAGEICIAGMGVGLGYLNQEALSAEKFTENPFVKGERMYRSGDIGRWQADGKLEYLGRKDDQVKIRGYRIEPGEIESVLQGHPSIATSAVVAQSNSQGDKELIAYLVSKDQDATLDVSDIRAYLSQHLPAYQVPAHYMQLESLPLTTNGKLDKTQLPSLDGLGSLRASEYVAPTTQREETIVGIWEEILNREPIGIRDDFFDLGGDSIKILRMMAGLRRELDLDVPIGEVYRQSTIESLLKHVDANKDVFDARNQTQNQHKVQVLEELEVLKSEILESLEDAQTIEDVYPMSDIEKGMIFESLVDSSKGMYHDQMVHQRIFKDFDPKRFENALRLLVYKHSILRTSFHMEGYATEVQMVHKDIDARLHYVNLRDQAREEQEKTIKDFLDNEMKSPFIVNTAPLWRMAAFDLGQDEVVFVFQCHHAIIDGWSDALFMTELNNLYLELEQNPAFSPTPLQSSYRDFIIEHEVAKRDPAIQTFWKEELKGYNRLTLFTEEEDISMSHYQLSKEEINTLEQFAKAHNTTVKAVSLGAYMYMLKVLSYNSEEIVTGLVSHMRPTCEDSDKLLGCFLNTIPFKVGVSNDISADKLIDGVHQKLIGLKDKERLSILEISLLHNKQGRQGNPFFDVLFDYVDFHAYGAIEEEKATEDQYNNLSGLSIGGIDLTNTFLDFIIDRTDGFYNLSIRLTHKLQCGFTTDRLAELYFAILSSMQEQPSAKLKDNDHLSQREQATLIEEFNTVEFNYNKDTTVNVLDLFQEQVQQHPDARALYYQGVTLSYKELDSQSDNLAYYLQNTCAIQKGDLVGIMQDRSEKMIVSILGILKSGAAYVPIDPSYPQERKEYIISDTAIRILLTQTDYMFDLGNYTGAVFAVDAQLESLESQTVSTKLTPTDLAYIIYTSGSTGQPKGCMLAHSNLSHYIQWANHHYFTPETGNFGLYTSLSFDLTITSIFSALTRGKELTIYGQYTELSDILKDSFSARSGIDSIKLTPSHIKLLEQLNIESTTMTRAIVGGEAVSTAHVQILKKINPDIRIFNEYGPTETTVGCMVEELEENKAVLIGKPISGTKIYILGPSLELLPIGVAGEICIAGMGVGLGYLNQEALSSEKFTENPFIKGERMYRSGDIGRWQADGKLEYLGRKDDQVKIRGYRIEPGEIESVLQGHPSIATSAVVAQSNNEGDKELIAYLVSKDQDATLDVSDIRAYLSQHLPSYQVPAHYMQLESLPLTTNGKLDKAQLPSLDGLGTLKSHAYAAPRTQSEQQLAVIWQEILNREQIGIHDNFFELGGHSLLAIKVLSRIRSEFNVEIKMETVFNDATIEFIAQEITRKQWVTTNSNLDVEELDTITI